MMLRNEQIQLVIPDQKNHQVNHQVQDQDQPIHPADHLVLQQNQVEALILLLAPQVIPEAVQKVHHLVPILGHQEALAHLVIQTHQVVQKVLQDQIEEEEDNNHL